MDPLRRAILSSIAAGTVSGCCRTVGLIRSDGDVNGLAKFDLASAPEPSDREVQIAIDAHTHIFNATDLQAGGYVMGPVLNEFGIRPEYRKLLAAAAKFIDAVATSLAPNTRVEYKWIRFVHGRMLAAAGQAPSNALRAQAALKALDDEIAEKNKEQAEQIYSETVRRNFKGAFDEYADVRAKRADEPAARLDEATVEAALNGNWEFAKGRFGEFEVEGLPNPFAVLEFIVQMLTFRLHSARKHQQAYRPEGGEVHCNRAVAAMVDFQVFLDDCPSYSPISDQILIYRLINRVLEDYVVTVAPFNPGLEDTEHQVQMDVLEQAISRRDIHGVKIYPTIGYWPYGNAKLGLPADSKRSPESLDESLGNLYELCTRHRIPVISHAGHSMAVQDKYKECAGPKGWRFALEKFAELKVNLGHFGGGHAPEGSPPWADKFVELMQDFSGVYADIGYWDELARGDGDRVALLTRLYQNASESGGKLGERLMFGSDWLMLLQDARWKRYAEDIHRQMVRIVADDRSLLDKFFNDNAAALFGIEQS